MAIRNDFKGGVDWTEEGLKPSDQNDTFDAFYRKLYVDDVGGEINTSTVETDLATITILQNDLGSNFSILVNAALEGRGTTLSSPYNNATFRLYVGGTLIDTVTLSTIVSGDDKYRQYIKFQTTLDSTAGDIIVKITGQNSQGRAVGDAALCHGMTVEAINNNN
jgi:hypothetical protein